jgi:hypothetical protein
VTQHPEAVFLSPAGMHWHLRRDCRAITEVKVPGDKYLMLTPRDFLTPQVWDDDGRGAPRLRFHRRFDGSYDPANPQIFRACPICTRDQRSER